ncbi:ATP-binding protein [Virgibacillus ndiopensis]|uniref:ATP-binding protein n=1 Tax=Virgibacillus ndiopensis TaxID=2004408 RepID=UPI000C076016|nr:AAA family ATPase [Virgibacillus ndiopensis]
MKLMHATVYGFGKWNDYSVDFSKQAFLCIFGENESGKSTLQQFILFMLFGFPPKKRSFFKPKTSGRMGGRLTLFDDSIGEFTIERTDDRNGAAKCFLPDGREFEEDWLRERLHGMTNKTYQSIFSFSANDLSILSEMNEDDLGEVLLGIGLTGSKNIYSIEKRIETKIGELFKPYGKKPTINQQLDSLDGLFQKLTSYKNDEALYREKKEKLLSYTNDIQAIKEDIKEKNQLLLSIEKQQQTTPLIHDYQNIKSQLSSYPADLTFPANGLSRLNVLKEQLLPMQSELSVIESNKRKYEEKQTMLKEELDDESSYNQAETIVQIKQDYMDNDKEITKLKDDLKKLDIQLENELSNLNIGLAVDDLAFISFPFHIENTWNQLNNDYTQLQLEKEQLQREESVLSNQQDNLFNQKQEIKTGLLPEGRVYELNETISEYKQQTSLDKLREDSYNQREKWQKIKEQKNRQSINLLIGSIIFALISGSFAVLWDSTIFYGLMAILILVGVIQWIVGKKSINNMEQMLLHDQIDGLGTQVTREVFVEAGNLLAFHNKRIADLDAIEDQIKTNDHKLLQVDERNNLLGYKQKRLRQKIDEQHTDYPFLENVDLSFWSQLYHTMKHLLQKYENKIEIERQINMLEDRQQHFNNVVNMFFHERNWESSNIAIVDQFEDIEEFVHHYNKTTALIDQYDKWITEAMEQYHLLKQKLSVYEKEISTLYDGAAVKTEEEFFQKAKKWDEKCALEEKVNERIGQILATFTQDEWEELAERTIDAQQLEVKHKEHVDVIKSLEKELDEKRQLLADVNADLAKMEISETYSETLYRYNMERENLHYLAKEWAVLKTAKEMLIETKRKFRDKYLTKVIDKTSHYFSLLTNYNYKRVFAPTDDQAFQVLAQNELKYTVKELSQGTRDQLYVALRIAISEVMSKNHHLPFIIDDAFVHFDASRTNQVMKILSEIAEHQQVIVFTCKKDIIETENKAEIVFLENTVRIN